MDKKLYGLVLTGGKSKRMGQDKALLKAISNKNKNDNNFTQTEKVFNILNDFCQKVYISSKSKQWVDNNSLNKLPCVYDIYDNIGPVGGVLSAFNKNKNVAWLVVACDLLYLDKNTIKKLVLNRNKNKLATIYKSSYEKHQGLPEPLCAIYEPEMYSRLLDFKEKNIYCPRKMMIKLGGDFLEMINLDNKKALTNINFKEEYEELKN